MSSQDFPSINGQKHAYGDIAIRAAGAERRGITSVDYKVKRAATDAHGTGPNRVGVALGKVSSEGSMEMYREDFQTLIDALGDGYLGVPFQVVVTYRVRIGARLIVDTLNAVRITEVNPSGQEGDDPMKVKLSLNIGETLLNGKRAA